MNLGSDSWFLALTQFSRPCVLVPFNVVIIIWQSVWLFPVQRQIQVDSTHSRLWQQYVSRQSSTGRTQPPMTRQWRRRVWRPILSHLPDRECFSNYDSGFCRKYVQIVSRTWLKIHWEIHVKDEHEQMWMISLSKGVLGLKTSPCFRGKDWNNLSNHVQSRSAFMASTTSAPSPLTCFVHVSMFVHVRPRLSIVCPNLCRWLRVLLIRGDWDRILHSSELQLRTVTSMVIWGTVIMSQWCRNDVTMM